ncbi:hypothetical protein GGR56DRAFT_685632 [Xylariaceae sp. FL0804]|nr:hypothetical protein GGR56DRAFT_685632 [Xylariaceae sp. FL0804]
MRTEASIYTPGRVIPAYAVIAGVGLALTALRIWTRVSYVRVRLSADDAAAAAAAVFVAAATGQEIANTVLGTGGNGIDDAADDAAAAAARRARIANQINWINPILEPWAFGLIKLSLSLFYRRIFGVWPAFRRANDATIALVAGYILAFSLGQLFLCGTRFHLIWDDLDQRSAREQCAERGRLQFAFALVSVVTDLLVLGLPLMFIGRLQMSVRKKWSTACVFLLGFIGTGASMARFIYVSVALKYSWFAFDYQAKPGVPAIPSPLFVTLNATLLATIEMGLGLWGANLPALAPLLHSNGETPVRYVAKRREGAPRKFLRSPRPVTRCSYEDLPTA